MERDLVEYLWLFLFFFPGGLFFIPELVVTEILASLLKNSSFSVSFC